MTFLDESSWRGKVFSGGWRRAEGREAAVTEPATGAELGRTGIASPADIAAAAEAAAAAQPAWAALPHTERAAYAQEVFAPVIRFSSLDEAARLAASTEYGLSLGILTGDAMHGLELARRIPTGIVHINDQTVDDAPNTPFGGLFASGTGSRFGGSANIDAFTEMRWITMRREIAPYPF